MQDSELQKGEGGEINFMGHFPEGQLMARKGWGCKAETSVQTSYRMSVGIKRNSSENIAGLIGKSPNGILEKREACRC